MCVPLPESMIGKFDIEFNIDGTPYTTTVENYLLPGQVKVTTINPAILGFPSEIVFGKNHAAKTLVYNQTIDQDIQAQIIEAVHHKDAMEGRPLYMEDIQ